MHGDKPLFVQEAFQQNMADFLSDKRKEPFLQVKLFITSSVSLIASKLNFVPSTSILAC